MAIQEPKHKGLKRKRREQENIGTEDIYPKIRFWEEQYMRKV